MFSNVGNTATIGFNGAFTIPPQTFDMIGSIGWTLPTTTETTSVPAGAIGSHGHFSGGTRVAVKESAEFPNRSTPYYLSAADVNLTAESGETYGGLCNEVARHYWQNVLAGSYGQGGPGICNGGNCASFKNHFLGYSHQNGANLTLIPPMSTANPPQNIAASNWVPDKTISGNDVVTATSWPNTAPAPGINVGLQRPYDTVNDDVSDPVYPTARNVEETCGVPPGSDTLDATLHSHIIDREIGDTDYTCTTAVATMRPDGLEASVNISTSGVNKFDDIVSPYIVMEFLIKY